MSEPKDNVVVTCGDCAEKIYPKKGTFTKNDLEGCTHVKKEFHGEHLWIKISEITDEGVKGNY